MVLATFSGQIPCDHCNIPFSWRSCLGLLLYNSYKIVNIPKTTWNYDESVWRPLKVGGRADAAAFSKNNYKIFHPQPSLCSLTPMFHRTHYWCMMATPWQPELICSRSNVFFFFFKEKLHKRLRRLIKKRFGHWGSRKFQEYKQDNNSWQRKKLLLNL